MNFLIPPDTFVCDENIVDISAVTIEGKPWLHLKPIAYAIGSTYEAVRDYLRTECPAAGMLFVKFSSPNGSHFALAVDETGMDLVFRRFATSEDPRLAPFVRWVMDEVIPPMKVSSAYEARALRGVVSKPVSAYFDRNRGPGLKNPPLSRLPESVPYRTPPGILLAHAVFDRSEPGQDQVYWWALELGEGQEKQDLAEAFRGYARDVVGEQKARRAVLAPFEASPGGTKGFLAISHRPPLLFGPNGERLTGIVPLRAGMRVEFAGRAERVIVEELFGRCFIVATLDAVRIVEAESAGTNPFL